MKLIIKSCFILWLTLLLFGCEDEITTFDNEKCNYIYLDLSYKLDSYNRPTTVRQNQFEYVFVDDPIDVVSHTFKIPVSIVGSPMNENRTYKIVLDTEHSNVTLEEWDSKYLESKAIKAGEINDTLFITVNRTKALSKEIKNIQLKLMDNSNFHVADTVLSHVNLVFSDILLKPEWWNKWEPYMGNYYKEVYLKWKEIYPEGVDNTINWDNSEPLSWKNMPSWASEYFFPTTFMFITVLKDYFDNNVIYPDNDESKPRIVIP